MRVGRLRGELESVQAMQAVRKEGVELGREHDPRWKAGFSLVLWQILIPCPEPRRVLSRLFLPPHLPCRPQAGDRLCWGKLQGKA